MRGGGRGACWGVGGGVGGMRNVQEAERHSQAEEAKLNQGPVTHGARVGGPRSGTFRVAPARCSIVPVATLAVVHLK